MGLPVLYGEVADDVQASFVADASVYHYHPSLDQARTWLDAAGFGLEEERSGHWYEHILVRKK
jgi:hypothetical protein